MRQKSEQEIFTEFYFFFFSSFLGSIFVTRDRQERRISKFRLYSIFQPVFIRVRIHSLFLSLSLLDFSRDHFSQWMEYVRFAAVSCEIWIRGWLGCFSKSVELISI